MLQNNIEKIEFSVSEISNQIKSLLEANFNRVRIKGEISGLKIATSGHGYFSLKDQSAVMAAICWRGVLGKINFKLSEGLEVVVTGKVTAYAGQSKYQISVEHIEPHGTGAFMQILTERRKAFQAEGLFDKSIKQKIPFLPGKIGIITSISGAVIKDIIHRISDRFPAHLIIWPVSVQGESSASEVTNAINGFNNMGGDEKPDLLIVARGGGSIEDLWSFNEEIVVRAAHKSKIPIISAVGHETDYTLLDLVADLRAPTPTAAAEFSSPVLNDLRYTLNLLYNKSLQKTSDDLKYSVQSLRGVTSELQHFANKLDFYSQKLDNEQFKLENLINSVVNERRNNIDNYQTHKIAPKKLLKYKYLEYKNLADNFLSKQYNIFARAEHDLEINSKILASLDYQKTLKRGYAIVKNSSDEAMSSMKDIEQEKEVKIKMHDGEIIVSPHA